MSKVYGEHAALGAVDLIVPRGVTCGLIGPDGAGKTTMLSMLAGLRRPTVLLSTHILSDSPTSNRSPTWSGSSIGASCGSRGRSPICSPAPAPPTGPHVRAPADPVLRALRGQAWVQQVTEHAPGRIHLVVTDAGAAERDIPRLLADHDVDLVSFNPATDLETAFLELIR